MIKKTLLFACTLFLACSTAAMADGNAFTPLNFDDASYGVPKTTTSTVTTTNPQDVVGNDKMQSAILQLDNAQVDVRNDLLNYKAKYSDVDAQYQLIKAERKALDKQIRTIERRIKQIDKTKETIRKNML